MTDEPRETPDEGLTKKTVSRRDFLRYAGLAGGTIAAAGGLGGLIAACGGTTTTTAASATTTTAGTGTTGTTAPGATTTVGPTTTVVTGPTPPTQDKIVIGASRSITGLYAFFQIAHFGPAYKLWVDDVNKAGGLNVAGKKLPIEMKEYDDQGVLDNATRNLVRLIEQDKVDFAFATTSTAYLFAQAGVANAHKFLFMSAEGGATTLEKQMEAGKLPLYFQFLNYSNYNQMPVMAEIMQELGIKTTSFLYIDDLHGIEYQGQATVFFGTPPTNAKILSNTAVPPGIKDMTAIIKKVQGENPDLLCSFQYPNENNLLLQTMQQLNYNPKALLIGPGGSTQLTYTPYKGAMDGCMFEGAWTPQSSPEIKAYYDKLQAFPNVGHENIDFWGPLFYRGQLEFFQQAIEKAATLDHQKIAEVMRTEHFKTILGDTFMTNQKLDLSCHPGQIGQWQKGIPEIIDPGAKRTAAPWYPKPTWADAPKGVPSTTASS